MINFIKKLFYPRLGAFTNFFQGNVAHDVADSGNPVKIGGIAKNYGSLPTAVTDADRVNRIHDRYGAAFVQNGSPYVRSYNAAYTTTQSSTAMLTAAANESIRLYGMIITLSYQTQALVDVTIGYGTVSTPSTDAVVFDNPGMVAGTYPITFPGAICGASGEDLRITASEPTGGQLSIIILYDIIAI